MDWLFTISRIIFISVSIILIFAVLMQESKGGGMGGMFGGGGASQVLGVQGKSIMKNITIWLAAILILSCLALNYDKEDVSSGEPQKQASNP